MYLACQSRCILTLASTQALKAVELHLEAPCLRSFIVTQALARKSNNPIEYAQAWLILDQSNIMHHPNYVKGASL